MNEKNENIFTFDTSVVDEISPYTSEQEDKDLLDEENDIMNPEDFGNDDNFGFEAGKIEEISWIGKHRWNISDIEVPGSARRVESPIRADELFS